MMNKHFNEAVEGDDGGLVICRGCKSQGTYMELPGGECPTPYKPDSVLLAASLAREQALQLLLNERDEQLEHQKRVSKIATLDASTLHHAWQAAERRIDELNTLTEAAYKEGWEMGWLERHHDAGNENRVSPWSPPKNAANREWLGSEACAAATAHGTKCTAPSNKINDLTDGTLTDEGTIAATRRTDEVQFKGMIEARGGKFAIMIDEANARYGWTFQRHLDGMWVSGRKATEVEMHAARTHAHITNQQ